MVLGTFYIKAVRYNPDKSIAKVKLANGQIETKEQVIKYIKTGYVYKTSHITVVEVIADKYLRTDRNNTKQDNLGNLPTF